jgi:hypothetical protein
MAAAPQTLAITRGSVQLITSSLSQPNWCKDTAKVYRVGKLIDNLETKFGEGRFEPVKGAAQSEGEKALRIWADQKVEFTVTERERDLIKECLEFHIKEGKIVATRHYNVVADAVGLAPTDD